MVRAFLVEYLRAFQHFTDHTPPRAAFKLFIEILDLFQADCYTQALPLLSLARTKPCLH